MMFIGKMGSGSVILIKENMTQQELESFASSCVGTLLFDQDRITIGMVVESWVEGKQVMGKFLLSETKNFCTGIIYHDGQEEKV